MDALRHPRNHIADQRMVLSEGFVAAAIRVTV